MAGSNDCIWSHNSFLSFYGFEWIQPFGKWGMYLLFSLIALSAMCIMLGFLYRLATILFFLSFSYSELIDATNYLNHYYLVCLLAFLLIFLPANRAYSIDVWRKPKIKKKLYSCMDDSCTHATTHHCIYLCGYSQTQS